jgi:hypothetical protein
MGCILKVLVNTMQDFMGAAGFELFSTSVVRGKS